MAIPDGRPAPLSATSTTPTMATSDARHPADHLTRSLSVRAQSWAFSVHAARAAHDVSGHRYSIPMAVLAPASSTPFVHPINLGTPLVAPIPPPAQMMPVGIAPSPSSAPMPPMPVFMTGGGTMPMTSPAVLPGNFVQTPMALPPPMPNAMAPPSPSFGVLAGALPQILEFDAHGPYAGLLYHSPHTVLHEGELVPDGAAPVRGA
jgi:hypothetical protein